MILQLFIFLKWTQSLYKISDKPLIGTYDRKKVEFRY